MSILSHNVSFTYGTYPSFVPYILFEVPSNFLMKKFKPHVWCKFYSSIA